MLTTLNGDTTIPLLTRKSPHIEEKWVRDELINELYLPITSTLVLKGKQEIQYVPLDSENNLIIDALVDSRAYVSAIT